MAYTKLTTAAGVEAYFTKLTFDDLNTQPSLTEVNAWIDEATAVIYGALQEKYQTPVTDACDLLQLKGLAEMYVVTKVRQVIGVASARTLENGDLVAVTESHANFYKILNKYQDCEIILPNTPSNSTKLQAYSYNDTNDICPLADKENDQW